MISIYELNPAFDYIVAIDRTRYSFEHMEHLKAQILAKHPRVTVLFITGGIEAAEVAPISPTTLTSR